MSARLFKAAGQYFALLCVVSIALTACASPTPVADTSPSSIEPTPEIDGEIPIKDLLVYVPAGRFYMGSNPELDPQAQDDEEPLHQVLLDGFFIYRDEVTNGLYKQCVAAGECTPPQIFEEGPSTHYNDPEYVEYPVVGVNWDQANAFCTWADSRLPTEAEWEKTSRGEFGDIYPWGSDSPDCTTSNMAGCVIDPADTDMIGQRPDGESVYEANDLSGNVWEWTSDWYQEDYYQQSPFENPTGPLDGKLRVVRGGSYEDGPETLRSAQRLALDPDQAYNNVGIRCVPIGLPSAAQAPFCQPTYIPYCADPNGGPEDCTPPAVGEQPQNETGYDFVAFGCPDSNGYVQVTVDAPGGLPGGTITVGGNTFTCTEDSTTPGRYRCVGPHPPQGTITTVEICSDGQQQGNLGAGGLVAFQPQTGAQASLVAFQPSAPAAQTAQLQTFQPSQPEGLQAFNPAPSQGLIAFQSAYSACPTGYLLNPETGQCELDPIGGCPQGTTYSPDQQGCTPDDGGACPVGYVADDQGACQPDGGDQAGACPAGYYYNADISCCSPLPGDNLGCEPGYYRSVATNECLPMDENGCQEGYVYNRYEGGCVPDTGDGSLTDGGCRLNGYVRNDQGQCVPDETPIQQSFGDCPDGSYYSANLQQCIELGEGECRLGYRFDQETQSCIPTDGPGSGCAQGYAYSERLNCCVPTPGNGGSYCPGDTPNGQTTNLSYFEPSQSGFDYGNGYCDPGDGSICPQGYTYDEGQQACVPTTEYGGSIGDCPAGTYYDQEMGYCVQTSCGCELGYYLDEQTQTCLPSGSTSGGCWSYNVSVPVCPYVPPDGNDHGCEKDENYNPNTGRCEKDPEPNCSLACVSSAYLCSLGPPYAVYELVCE